MSYSIWIATARIEWFYVLCIQVSKHHLPAHAKAQTDE
jgi:hypothetical protein